jgi:hypothetical protein
MFRVEANHIRIMRGRARQTVAEERARKLRGTPQESFHAA